MQVSLLIYLSRQDMADRHNPEKAQAYWTPWPDFVGAMREAGVLIDGMALDGPATARTLSLDSGLVEDGPFADTKESLAGLFLIEVPDMDSALVWAKRVPSAPGRKVEVRPNLAVGQRAG